MSLKPRGYLHVDNTKYDIIIRNDWSRYVFQLWSIDYCEFFCENSKKKKIEVKKTEKKQKSFFSYFYNK